MYQVKGTLKIFKILEMIYMSLRCVCFTFIVFCEKKEIFYDIFSSTFVNAWQSILGDIW